jgi:hypothetical protein
MYQEEHINLPAACPRAVVCGSLSIKEYLRHWLQQYRSLAHDDDCGTAVGDGSVGVTAAPEVAALSCFELNLSQNYLRTKCSYS